MQFTTRVGLIITIITFSLPLVASAATAAELQAQVSALLQQVQILQQFYATQPAAGSGTSGGGGGATCPQLGRVLALGSSGDDVSALQTFLAADPSVYPEGKVSGYYGALTQAAVQRFQAKAGVASSGTPSTTGYGKVGPKTIAAIALSCSNSGGASSDVGAVMKVTPITGAAPLHVSFQVTVNTAGSCAAGVYMLDFGDGSSQPVPSVAGVCQPQSITVAHDYPYGGAYRVTLSSGGHQTYTNISVTGMTAPVPVGTNTTPQVGVNISEYAFTPANITINPGTVVTWTNSGMVSHTVIAVGGQFASGDIAPGKIYSVRFDQPGTYVYYCKYHGTPGSGELGSVTVNGASGQAGASAGGTTSTSQQSSTYSPLTVTSQGNRQAVASFVTKGSCDTYSLTWGDNSNPVFRPAGSTSCTSGEKTTITHTYAANGTYTVTLDRGPGLTDEVTAVATITN